MARARNIKPGFFKNEDLAECSAWARLCFAGLWTLADREGRLEDRPKRIKGELFAFDSISVEPLLNELAEHHFIERYVVDGQNCIQVVEFLKHQNPHWKEPPSTIPPAESLGLFGHSMAPESRASPSTNGSKAPDQPEAFGSTLEVSSGQNPADPGTLNPSSLIPEPPPRARAREEGSAIKGSDVTRALKGAGIGTANPTHPTLLMLLEAGATVDEFVQAADKARDKGKPFEYLLGVVKGQREQAALASNGVHKGPMGPAKSYRERDAEAKAAINAKWTTKKPVAPLIGGDTIDMEAPDDQRKAG